MVSALSREALWLTLGVSLYSKTRHPLEVSGQKAIADDDRYECEEISREGVRKS